MNSPAPGVSLRPLTTAQANALAQGRRLSGWHTDYPTDDEVVLARLWLEAPWEPVPQQVLHDGKVVGGIATKGAMTEGEVEIGYVLVDSDRGHGVGTAALQLMLEHLESLGASRVVAETAADNGASQRLLLRAGFTVLGENATEVLFNKHL